MTIKDLKRHRACFNYEKGNEPFVEVIEELENACGKILLDNHVVFYILKGEAKFAYSVFSDTLAKENQMFFVPLGSELRYEVSEDFICVLFRLEDEIRFCDCFTGTMLKDVSKTIKKDSPCVITADKFIRNYVENLRLLVSCKMLCRIFFDYKRKELLYLFQAFYPKDELALFFYEGLSENTSFSCSVIRNYRRFPTIAKLAESLNYTVSGFEKRFKKTFGVSPSKWLREQKAKDIYRDVCLGELNFKEITDKYNFSSTSTFNDFYKAVFGETPGVTRKKQSNGLFRLIRRRI